MTPVCKAEEGPDESPPPTAARRAGSGSTRAGVLANDLRADPSALQRTTGQRGNGALVIAIDEFEELFTQCVEEAERCCFGTLQTLRQADPRHAFASSSS
jgi:hypothetical protein